MISGGISAYFGKRSGPTLGSWHGDLTLSAYFRDTILDCESGNEDPFAPGGARVRTVLAAAVPPDFRLLLALHLLAQNLKQLFGRMIRQNGSELAAIVLDQAYVFYDHVIYLPGPALQDQPVVDGDFP